MLLFISVVPNYCWYGGDRFECGLSLSCVFSGAKAMDLCNGGMIWSCCVPRDRIKQQSQVNIFWGIFWHPFVEIISRSKLVFWWGQSIVAPSKLAFCL